MAAINFNEMGDRDGGSLTAAINWAGAFLSVLLIVGLATWGWKLWRRDVTGIPVVLDRLNIDPALASGAFVTTVTDVVGFFAFLGLAAAVLL